MSFTKEEEIKEQTEIIDEIFIELKNAMYPLQETPSITKCLELTRKLLKEIEEMEKLL